MRYARCGGVKSRRPGIGHARRGPSGGAVPAFAGRTPSVPPLPAAIFSARSGISSTAQNRSTSGRSVRSARASRDTRHPSTARTCPFLFAAPTRRISSTDSSIALAMNAHVVTTSSAASPGEAASPHPACSSPAATFSASTRFFGHPRLKKK
ncbi:MAG: hypothetical protein NTW97_01775 [Candidatus Krumholzibacteria bacterium]|nr:hypothetical protein [Candidatus Krumholzibacteria bacterium]